MSGDGPTSGDGVDPRSASEGAAGSEGNANTEPTEDADANAESTGDPPAVETEGLVREFGDVRAVDGLDLTVEAGTVYGFVGPNGAGKTTTIRMLTTLLRPTRGTARVMGVSVEDRWRVVERVGYLPETPPLYAELTGREQLQYVADLWGLGPAATDRADRLLARFGLAGDADRRISGYSTGMKKQLGIVQALLHDPDVLFLDEPTAGLDPRAARTVRETVAELADRDVTVVLSSHVLGVVEAVADRVGVLAEGRLLAEGTPAELAARTGASREPLGREESSGGVDRADASGSVDRADASGGASAGGGAGGATLEEAFLAITHDRAREDEPDPGSGAEASGSGAKSASGSGADAGSEAESTFGSGSAAGARSDPDRAEDLAVGAADPGETDDDGPQER